VTESSTHAPHQAAAHAAEQWYKPAFILFLIVWLGNWLLLLLRIELQGQARWLEALLPLLAAVLTIAGLSRKLPLQNALAIVTLITGMAWGVMAFAMNTGIPFGRFIHLPAFGEQLPGGVGWPVPLLWVVVIVNAREVARLILSGLRGTDFYGFWIMGLTGLLAVLFELGLEPFATQFKSYWLWLVGDSVSTCYTSSWVKFASQFLVVFCLQIILVPWFINKQPAKQRDDFYSLAVWLLLNSFIATGNAMQGHWLAVGIVGTGNLAVLFFALHGARR